MPELTPKERLQPSLLDRLTDEERDQRHETRDKRVLSLQKFRAAVLRDISWLFNTINLDAAENLQAYPLIRRSVLNYGLPDLSGRGASNVDAMMLERILRQVLWDYEPRIVRNTVRVRHAPDPARLSHNALVFEIEGELWAQPTPLRLYVRTELDLEEGKVTISERAHVSSATKGEG